MRKKLTISILVSFLFVLPVSVFSQQIHKKISFDFYGDSIQFIFDPSSHVPFTSSLSNLAIANFYEEVSAKNYSSIIDALKSYKKRSNSDDWLFYQLVRRTAQFISPKAENYNRYTLYKWFLLMKTGYDSRVRISTGKILLYAQCDEKIYNIPSRIDDGRQYVCLNYHDYGAVDFDKERFTDLNFRLPEAQNSFSYKVTQLPDFDPENYLEKDINFSFYERDYQYKVKLNPQVQAIFKNYPVVDYSYYFNIPLSNETYSTLIPKLKNSVRKMTKKNGVDYLMRFTRYAFLFEKDSDAFGKEKRLSPEETLLYGSSDCDDRAALFFYLVKEIYNLPMIALVYPTHVTVAVELDKPVGKPIIYDGKKYSLCEPTPQKTDLRIGQRVPALNKSSYEVVYAYNPQDKK